MPTDDAEQPFVDDDTATGATDALTRILQTVAPDSFVPGGASKRIRPQQRPHDYEELKKREQVYTAGGPITDFVDTRALMTYGTGVEFTTPEEEIVDEQGRTVAEWLHDQFPLIDQTAILRGQHAYVFGDAWPEVVLTRGGDVSHINLIHPTTVDPDWDAHGTITDLEQVIKGPRGKFKRKPLADDTVGHWFYKSVSSGPLGDSLLEQNWQEVEWYWDNQTQRANAIELHGSPKYHVQVGSEGQSIPDRLLRRVRNRFRPEETDEKTNWVTGGDIEIGELDAPGFDGMDNITETDVTKLASGFGVPLEWTNFGSAGLGDGTPAESRIKKFERQARAEQKRAAEQMREFPFRMIVDDFSPFPPGTQFEVTFGDVISDPSAIAEWLQNFTEFYTRDQIRQKFGDEALTDEQEQAIEDRVESGGDEVGGGGLFAREAREAPDPLADDAAAKRAHADGGTAAEGGGGGAEGNVTGRALLHGEGASADALTQEELVWEEVYDRVLWNEDEEATERALFEFGPSEVPDFVLSNLREAIQAGAVFDSFDTIGAAGAQQVESALLDSLDKGHGWSINSITENIRDAVPGELDYEEAERIARTETASLVNDAREDGYEEEFDMAEERFKWVGPDRNDTDACEWLKEQTNPDYGGTPRTLPELKELVREAQQEFFPDLSLREWVIHPNERHTFSRVVE